MLVFFDVCSKSYMDVPDSSTRQWNAKAASISTLIVDVENEFQDYVAG